ncbi:MAG: UDP-N-acetylglucosamine 2-epimerase [Desulfobaccales bacterium]
MAKRKVAIVVNSRANYGRIKSVLSAVQEHPNLDLKLIVGASALLHRFGQVVDIIKSDGFQPEAVVYSIVEGENPTTMAKSTGMGILELSTQFENIKPDVVVTVADRFETMATAIAASYMNIPLAHTQGGEVTGSIDESVRHAVTKLAHIHFPATEKARENLIRMGEDPETIFLTGCPAMDLLCDIDLTLPENIFVRYKGVGADLDPRKPYLVVLQHPVTTEYQNSFAQINETLTAIKALRMQTVWLWPNVDAGSDAVSKGLRVFREREKPDYIHFYRNFPPEDYGRLIANCICLVGNSSSGIREGSFLGVPTVNIGTRQAFREHGENVINVGYEASSIEMAIRRQINNGKHTPNQLYGDGKAGRRIAEILGRVDFKIQKRLRY